MPFARYFRQRHQRCILTTTLLACLAGAALSGLAAAGSTLAEGSLLGSGVRILGLDLRSWQAIENSTWRDTLPVPGLPPVRTALLGSSYFSFLFVWLVA